jgi:hypothetical protein
VYEIWKRCSCDCGASRRSAGVDIIHKKRPGLPSIRRCRFSQPPLSLSRAKEDALSLSISKVSPVRSQGPRPVHTAPREGGSGKGEDKDDVGK